MNKGYLLIIAVLLSVLVTGTVGIVDGSADSESLVTTVDELTRTDYYNMRDRGDHIDVFTRRRSHRRRRKLNIRHQSRLPVSDDGGPKEDEKGPHHYKHYRCSACVKDKDKREREREEAHEAEILQNFEAKTNKGLAEAQAAALQVADTLFDSTQGMVGSNATIVSPSSTSSTSSTNTTKRLRLRM